MFEGLPALWLRVHGESPENVDIARMLHAKRDRIQKAPLSEIRNFTGEQHAKLQDVISGNRQRTLGEIIASPFTMYANAAMNFYSKFTQHNGIVTMVTAYRKFKKQGMTHEQAMDAAELFDLTVNNSGGRLERPEMFGKLGGVGHLPIDGNNTLAVLRRIDISTPIFKTLGVNMVADILNSQFWSFVTQTN